MRSPSPSPSTATRFLGATWSAWLLLFAIAGGGKALEQASGASPEESESAATVRRVVLLHGLGRGAYDLALLGRRLEQRGYVVCNVDYATRHDTIEEVVVDVLGGIRACAFDGVPVHYVTHSLGGLVLRALSREGQVVAGGRAVMIAPPNAGSALADRLGERAWIAPILGPLGPQLGTQPQDLPLRLPPPSIPFGVIAGDRWINPLGAFWLSGAHDGTVSVESTRLAGMTDHRVLPYTHTFIAWAEPVADAVDSYLRAGRFGPP